MLPDKKLSYSFNLLHRMYESRTEDTLLDQLKSYEIKVLSYSFESLHRMYEG